MSFMERNDLGGGDTGIDLVAQTFDADYWAIQCKCYQQDSLIDKRALTVSFLHQVGDLKTTNLKTVSFSHRL